MKSELKSLSRDLYENKNLTFNNVSGNDALRNMITEKMGGEFNVYNFNRHKIDIYELLSVGIDAVLPSLLTSQYDALADVRTVAIGTKPVFEVQDPRAIRVSRISAGNADLRRQTVTGRNFTVETDWFGATVYAELEQFMAGEIDWQKLVDKVAAGFQNHLQVTIADALSQSYNLLGATAKVEGSVKLEQVIELAQRIQAKSGTTVSIYGTKIGLNKLAKLTDMSNGMKDENNNFGYLGTIAGIKAIEIPQALKVNSDEFAIDDNTLLIVPDGEKIVTVVLEGDAVVSEPEATTRNDVQLGFQTRKKLGASVLQMEVYGMVKFS